MKHDKCPYCGRKFGEFVRFIPIGYGKIILWDEAFNYISTIFDSYKDDKLVCRNCDNFICNYTEMFKEELIIAEKTITSLNLNKER